MWSSACAGSAPGRRPSGDSIIAIPLAACTMLSNPRRPDHGPAAPQADSDAMTSDGWAATRASIGRDPGRYPCTSTSACDTSSANRSDRTSSRAVRFPAPPSRCCHSISGSAGGSIRSTSAPQSARVRVATGPAITRVRSSTRALATGRGAPAPRGDTASRGSDPTTDPCGCAAHCCCVRTAAAMPPPPTMSSSASSAVRLPSRARSASAESGIPRAAPSRSRWCG